MTTPEWFSQLGLMGWPLAVCSVLALALCLERSVFTVISRRRRHKQYTQLSEHLISHRRLTKPLRDDLMTVEMERLGAHYYSGLKELRIIATISPMLGLLGTVLGIITTFKIISAQPGPVSPAVMADGLWEALLTTAAGLLIALPSLLMAHLFRRLGERRLEDFRLRLNELSISFETTALSAERMGEAERIKGRSKRRTT